MDGVRSRQLGRRVVLLVLAGCGAASEPGEATEPLDGQGVRSATDANGEEPERGDDSKRAGSTANVVGDDDHEAANDPSSTAGGGLPPVPGFEPPAAGERGPVDAADVLFIVDDSGSMEQEQAALAEQLPRLIDALTAKGRGGPEFESLHLGVVSSDMGLIGISDIDMCSGLGDDGVLQHGGGASGCDSGYPTFLSYAPEQETVDDAAHDLACMTTLGTDGCGFEQQLEAGLKALWPADDDRVTFLTDVNGFGGRGHGDSENRGFLRTDSALVVILVSDEEDCSSKDTRHFTPSTYLDPDDPADAQLINTGLNVRCHANPQALYETSRYVAGLRALRPGREDLVLFAALVGVPPETVSADVVAGTDFRDQRSRAELYRGILEHPLMQETVDTNGTPDPVDDVMKPSCQTTAGLAYPPRRIVSVAQGFGSNGLVQSICQQDFGSAIDAISARMNDLWGRR